MMFVVYGRARAFLKHLDEAEAVRCRAAGCPHCGAALHSATYPRKPHGLAPGLRDPETDAMKEGNADNGGVRRTPVGQP